MQQICKITEKKNKTEDAVILFEIVVVARLHSAMIDTVLPRPGSAVHPPQNINITLKIHCN